MKESTRDKIKEFTVNFAKGLTEIPFTVDELKRAFPFHTIVNVIDKIANDLRSGRRRPDFDAENDEILQASSDERESVKIIADLYIGDIEPGPVFMEIKSPRPNLDVCWRGNVEQTGWQRSLRSVAWYN